MSYVYRHIRHDKNEVFYVGIGSDGSYRRARNTTLRSDLWKRVASKTTYSIDILVDGVSREYALEKEKEFIALYGRINTGTGTLTNLNDGGLDNKGFILTDEQRDKMRASARNKILTPELRKAYSDAGKSRVITDDTRRKLSDAQKGRPKSAEHRAKISQFRTGRKASEETKAKLREKRKDRVIPPEVGDKISASLKGRAHSASHNRNNALSNSRFSIDQINEIKRLSASGLNYPQIAGIYGVSKSTIHLIVRNKTYNHLIDHYAK